jgi:N-acetylglutamate synthase-like GNAT family acetyltransferase
MGDYAEGKVMPEFDYVLKSGFNKMDFGQVTRMLKNAWWSVGIKEEEVVKGAQNSALIVGAFTREGLQVGYARVISDKTRFAYILDVYVDENHRRKQIGQNMIKYILNHPELKDVYQWTLTTRDAPGFYSKIGFQKSSESRRWMEIWHERPIR